MDFNFTEEEILIRDALLMKMFEIFDADGNGTVDLQEIIAGVTVLCGGTAEEKLRAFFDLIDLDGNNAIDLNEMTLYYSGGKMIYSFEECYLNAISNKSDIFNTNEFNNYLMFVLLQYLKWFFKHNQL